MSGAWIICQKCGLGQNAQAEATCSSCGADISTAIANAKRPYTPMSALGGVPEGNLGLGVGLGVVFGLWGLIGAMILGRGETKKGAAYGYGARLLITFIVVLFVLAAG